MKIPPIGIGTYRMSTKNRDHARALEKALKAGINLIDTSSNYYLGESEELIGKVIEDLKDQIKREDLVIVSKFGYMQGDVLNRYCNGEAFDEVVEFGPRACHCIHPGFMKDQLTQSLDRMNLDYIDIYLIHNPEYFLMSPANCDEDREKVHQELFRRIFQAFIALEEEVRQGRIRFYGISSNSFSLEAGHPHFIPYQGLVDMAQDAARKTGSERHHFTAVQFPGNLLETEGLKHCAPWARSSGLKVLINRPLNALDENKVLHRLAETSPPRNYWARQQEFVESIRQSNAGHLADYFKKLNLVIPAIRSVDQVELLFTQQLIPITHDIIRNYDMEEIDTIGIMVNNFYRKAMSVAFKNTQKILKKHGICPEGSLREHAMNFVLMNPGVDCVLNGMRRVQYVDFALDMMKMIKKK